MEQPWSLSEPKQMMHRNQICEMMDGTYWKGRRDMAQIKIYGLAERLDPIKARLSELLHTAAVTAFELPPGKPGDALDLNYRVEV
ncbi:putative transglutaminase [Paenibacillus sp. 598K]|nr:putative transglutaminase [Paenibacillus sp. 598K]